MALIDYGAIPQRQVPPMPVNEGALTPEELALLLKNITFGKAQAVPSNVNITAKVPVSPSVVATAPKQVAEGAQVAAKSAEGIVNAEVKDGQSTFAPIKVPDTATQQVTPLFSAPSSAPSATEAATRQALTPKESPHTNPFDVILPNTAEDSVGRKVKDFFSNPMTPMAALFGLGFFSKSFASPAEGFANGLAAMGEGIATQREREMAENTQNIAQQKANTEQVTAGGTLAANTQASAANITLAQQEAQRKAVQWGASLGLEQAKVEALFKQHLIDAKGNITKAELAMQQSILHEGTLALIQKMQQEPDPVRAKLMLLTTAAKYAEFAEDKEAAFVDILNKWERYFQRPETLTKPGTGKVPEVTQKEAPSDSSGIAAYIAELLRPGGKTTSTRLLSTLAPGINIINKYNEAGSTRTLGTTTIDGKTVYAYRDKDGKVTPLTPDEQKKLGVLFEEKK